MRVGSVELDSEAGVICPILRLWCSPMYFDRDGSLLFFCPRGHTFQQVMWTATSTEAA